MKVTKFQFVLVIGKYMQTWKLLNLEVFLVISFPFFFLFPFLSLLLILNPSSFFPFFLVFFWALSFLLE